MNMPAVATRLGSGGRDHHSRGTVDDRDTLHTLPLIFMPLQKDTLKRARMIKNVPRQHLWHRFEVVN